MRYFIQLSFDGTAYHGWQIQENAHTVQAELNKSLSILLKSDVQTLGCGRTDTGVHAKKFYAHFDAELSVYKIKDLIHQLNSLIAPDIAIQDITAVADNAHVRFDASSRTYEYTLYQSKNPFLRTTAWYLPAELDLEKMNSLSSLLLTHRDFSCFSKSRTQTFTNNCIISEARWKQKENTIVFRITADRFLRNMVRAIVGTLIEGGKGKLEENQLNDILASKNRTEAGPSVPAHGLALIDIIYPYL